MIHSLEVYITLELKKKEKEKKEREKKRCVSVGNRTPDLWISKQTPSHSAI